MYLKHLNQTNRTMNVTIEHVFCRYSDEAEEIYFRIMNTILFATDETELRASMERLKNETSLDEYFYIRIRSTPYLDKPTATE